MDNVATKFGDVDSPVCPDRIGRLERRSLGGYLGIVAVDADGLIRYVSTSLNGVFGLSVEEVEGRSFLEFLHPGDVEQAVESFTGVADRAGHHQVITLRLVGTDTNEFAVDVVADNQLDDPDVGLVILNLADPRDRRRSAQLLGIQADVVRHVALGTSILDATLEVLRFVETALPGFQAAAYIFDTASSGSFAVSPSVSQSVLDETMRALDQSRTRSGNVSVNSPIRPGTLSLRDEEIVIATDLADPQWLRPPHSDTSAWQSTWSVPIRFGRADSVRGLVEVYGPHAAHPSDEDWSILDLTSRMIAIAIDNDAMRTSLERDATIDELTGLPNRRVIDQLLAGVLSSDHRGHVVCFIDLDNLKVVNDGLGHEAGDRMIRAASDRLAQAVGVGGVLCRFGGDEFVVIVDSNGQFLDHEAIARSLLDAFRAPIETSERSWQMTASIGVVVTDAQSSPGEVLRDADTAMYVAKRTGRNRAHLFATTSRDGAIGRMRLESQLRDAVRNHEIEAWFQPIVRSSDWAIVGLEALARWQLPDGSWISPNQFVPLAEEINLMDELGSQMIDQAINALHQCAAAGLVLDKVSVNVSPTQLRTEKLFEQLERLAQAGEPVDSLCIEITEQHMIDDTELTQSQLARILSYGPSLAVDDFGTGYSSLASLDRIPAQTLKIDRALVAQSGLDSGRAVLRATVAVAKAFDLHVIAEGVETVEEALRLRSLGAGAQQGFLFARPAPLAQIIAQASTSEWMWEAPQSALLPVVSPERYSSVEFPVG